MDEEVKTGEMTGLEDEDITTIEEDYTQLESDTIKIDDDSDLQNDVSYNQALEYKETLDEIKAEMKEILLAVLEKGEINANDTSAIEQLQEQYTEGYTALKTLTIENNNISDTNEIILDNTVTSDNLIETLLQTNILDVVADKITLTADHIDIHGYVTANEGFSIDTEGNMIAKNGTFNGKITGGTIDIGDGAFKVGSTGNLKIGGLSAVTYDDIVRGIFEVTSKGTIFSCSSTNPSLYTRISEGDLKIIRPGYSLEFDSDAMTISSQSNTANYTTTKVKGSGNMGIISGVDGKAYLICEGGALDDDEATDGKKAIVFFKNSEGNYVCRSRSLSGETYLGTSTYYWKQVAATEFKNTSDRTLKENITYLSNSKAKSASDITIYDMYNFVKDDLPIATYNYIDDDTEKVGFIAQDIIYNEDESDNIIGQLIVNPQSYNEEEGHLTYDINNYVSVLAGALQVALKKIDELENEINNIKEGDH